VSSTLVPVMWRPAVFATRRLPAGAVDRDAYMLCLLEQLRTALRRRDVFAHLRLSVEKLEALGEPRRWWCCARRWPARPEARRGRLRHGPAGTIDLLADAVDPTRLPDNLERT
jgi:hypothetical protein